MLTVLRHQAAAGNTPILEATQSSSWSGCQPCARPAPPHWCPQDPTTPPTSISGPAQTYGVLRAHTVDLPAIFSPHGPTVPGGGENRLQPCPALSLVPAPRYTDRPLLQSHRAGQSQWPAWAQPGLLACHPSGQGAEHSWEGVRMAINTDKHWCLPCSYLPFSFFPSLLLSPTSLFFAFLLSLFSTHPTPTTCCPNPITYYTQKTTRSTATGPHYPTILYLLLFLLTTCPTNPHCPAKTYADTSAFQYSFFFLCHFLPQNAVQGPAVLLTSSSGAPSSRALPANTSARVAPALPCPPQSLHVKHPTPPKGQPLPSCSNA